MKETPPEPPKLLKLPKRHSLRSSRNPEQILKRQEQAFELRSQGKTFKTIADILNTSVATVHSDLRIIAKLKYAGLIEKDEHALLEQNQFLDALLERWLPLATNENLVVGTVKEDKDGNPKHIFLETWEAAGTATDKVLKILQQKATINGLVQSGQPKSSTTEELTNITMAVLAGFQNMQPKQATIIDVEHKKIEDQ